MGQRITVLLGLLALSSCKPDNEVIRRSQIDTFYQNPTDQVDILWVVDDSASMEDEQAEVADKFANFVASLEETKMDFHIGVVTTDMEIQTRGQLIGSPAVLTKDTPDYEALFRQRVQVGVEGSDREQGIDAAFTALSEPLVSGVNAGFLRSGATLSVIYLSDENDCTDRGALDQYEGATACYEHSDELISVRDLIADYEGLKKNDDRILVSAIVGPEATANCDGAAPGFRYTAMAEAFGGVRGSICQASFASIMTELGLQASGLLNSFQLTYDAVESTLHVYTDDPAATGEQVELPEEDALWIEIPQGDTDGWTYDATYAVIYLNGTAVPARGSILKVSYEIVPGSQTHTDDTGR